MSSGKRRWITKAVLLVDSAQMAGCSDMSPHVFQSDHMARQHPRRGMAEVEAKKETA